MGYVWWISCRLSIALRPRPLGPALPLQVDNWYPAKGSRHSRHGAPVIDYSSSFRAMNSQSLWGVNVCFHCCVLVWLRSCNVGMTQQCQTVTSCRSVVPFLLVAYSTTTPSQVAANLFGNLSFLVLLFISHAVALSVSIMLTDINNSCGQFMLPVQDISPPSGGGIGWKLFGGAPSRFPDSRTIRPKVGWRITNDAAPPNRFVTRGTING